MKKLAALFIVCVAIPIIALVLSAYGLEVPEPGNIAVLGIGIMGLGLARHRARQSRQ